MIIRLARFRQDLRLYDNLILVTACRNPSARTLALYIATPCQWAVHNVSPCQAELISVQLSGLQIALMEKGIPLLPYEMDDSVASIEIVKRACAENSVTHLFHSYQYEVNERARDAEVERALRNAVCERFNDNVILPPSTVVTDNHKMYKAFTPFENAWLKRLREGVSEYVATPKVRSGGSIEPAPPITLNHPRQSFDTAYFPVKEETAVVQLYQLCQNGVGEREQ